MHFTSSAKPYHQRQDITLDAGFLQCKRIACDLHVHGEARQNWIGGHRIGDLIWCDAYAALRTLAVSLQQIDTSPRLTTQHRLDGH
ncbi:MAG: hypothetical protein VX293_03700 [Candidatus Latescibacterota bacterium]|nr:hypothetical protein [Candidatus Latescibacterota bacterium]